MYTLAKSFYMEVHNYSVEMSLFISISLSHILVFAHLIKNHIEHFDDTPLFKIPIENPVWEPFPADTDPFQDTITA